MGFNKSYLTIDKIIKEYENNSLDGVKTLLNMYDTYICDDISSEVIESYNKNELTDEVLMFIVRQVY